ncbi:5-(carboxyamino)imidazole ribonucleotide synthase [Pedobacter antarcticus]|uniref:N5-carboxyaminoimidazole ribonucleotide synthase n=2 Tax=Pedobacter antarcticus TaxID=34086 RepID=A0A081PD15_9SPHI|nr:5-(carboxyamino)imidazole ribonucleotide synthase [Pedobacter antarcticus]KEQ28588.1 phosphoribosylaminoimidazole carboxylase [Pedobacter antarcticus 4BY]SDL48868.1 5-(carboxyamino)imidazole ribonucleotide synthase [Pedobacter antarcticus]SFE36427.1 5-(carboxyamino)imidazole ribonucleotide synthase [Pedobacter antarcticus]
MAKQISDLKLGILGGGQLGRMLIQEAINYNLTTLVLDPDHDAPCKHLANTFECGSITDFDTVYKFGKKVDVITIEIEKVNIEALEQLEKEGKQVYPQSRVIRLIQDKGVQKQFFKENDIPTAPFQLANSREEMITSNFPYPYMLKQRKDGYDGKGVMRINSVADLDHAFTSPCLMEELVDFEKEIAVIVARNANGDVKTFPLVEMEFNAEANLVEFLISPSTYPEPIQARAEAIAVQIAEALNITGLLAVEMFITKDGRILVNELAPRPHNSGHHTIEGNYVSQFEQHLRSIFNLPLGDTRTVTNAVMINLLGEKGHDGVARYQGLEKILAIDGVYVHLYGKKYTKPFRKMGHVTIIDQNREAAIEKANFIRNTLKVIS